MTGSFVRLTGHLGRILFFLKEQSAGLAEILISGFFLDGVLNFKLKEKTQVLHGIYRLCRPGAGRKTCVT